MSLYLVQTRAYASSLATGYSLAKKIDDAPWSSNKTYLNTQNNCPKELKC